MLVASASEKTATVRNPNRRALRIILSEISPRLAMRSFLRSRFIDGDETTMIYCGFRIALRTRYNLTPNTFRCGKGNNRDCERVAQFVSLVTLKILVSGQL